MIYNYIRKIDGEREEGAECVTGHEALFLADTLSLMFKKLPKEFWDRAIDDMEKCANETVYAFDSYWRNEGAYATRAIVETYAILAREKAAKQPAKPI